MDEYMVKENYPIKSLKLVVNGTEVIGSSLIEHISIGVEEALLATHTTDSGDQWCLKPVKESRQLGVEIHLAVYPDQTVLTESDLVRMLLKLARYKKERGLL